MRRTEDAACETTTDLFPLFPTGHADLLIVAYRTYQILCGFTVSWGGWGSVSEHKAQCLCWVSLLLFFSGVKHPPGFCSLIFWRGERAIYDFVMLNIPISVIFGVIYYRSVCRNSFKPLTQMEKCQCPQLLLYLNSNSIRFLIQFDINLVKSISVTVMHLYPGAI